MAASVALDNYPMSGITSGTNWDESAEVPTSSARETLSWSSHALALAGVTLWHLDIPSGKLQWNGASPFPTTEFATLVSWVVRDDQDRFNRAIEATTLDRMRLDVEVMIASPGQEPKRWRFQGSISESGADASQAPAAVLGTIGPAADQPTNRDRLREIAEGLDSQVGHEFFRALLSTLAVALKADFALISEFNGPPQNNLTTVEVWADGAPAENMTYELMGSPCERVANSGYCLFPSDVQALFPNDWLLADMEIEAYAGFPLVDETGQVIGLLVALWRTVLSDADFTEQAMRIFASRVTAELGRLRSERALRQSELRVQSILDNAPSLAVQGYDLHGHVKFWNPASERMFGLRAEEVIGCSLGGFLMPNEEHNQFLRHLDQIRQTGKPVAPYEVHFTRPDGECGTCLSSIFQIPGLVDEPIYICMDVDVSDLHRTEEVLRNSERKLLTIMQGSGFGYWEWDLPSNIIRTQHPDSGRFGVTSEKLQSWEQLMESIHTDDLATTDEAMRRLLAGETGEYISEHRLLTGNGGYRWVLARGKVIDRDERGEPITVAGTHLDITERRSHEEEISASESHFYNLFHLSPEITALQDFHTGQFLDVNQGFSRVLGYTLEDVLGKTPDDLHLVAEPDHRKQARRQLEQTGYVEYDCLLNCRNGQRLEAQTHARLLVQDERTCLISVMHDVTERRRAERHNVQQNRRLQSLRAVDMALSSSFDLRVTLGVIADQALSVLGAVAARVSRTNDVTHELEELVQRGLRQGGAGRALKINESPAGLSIRERRTLTILMDEVGGCTQPFPGVTAPLALCYCVPLVSKGRTTGVLEAWSTSDTPDDEWISFLEALAGQAAIAMDNAALFEDLQRANLDMSLALEQVLEVWSDSESICRSETTGSGREIADLAVHLARKLGVPESAIVHLRRAALLRDLSMSHISDGILNSPDSLSTEQWAAIRQHPGASARLLQMVPSLREAAELVLHHHEAWNGQGYPEGLLGERIPLRSRILAVADAFYAMISLRPHRPARSPREAMEEIERCSGTQFDPQLSQPLRAWLEEYGPQENG